jgi:hypothetical protein
MKAWVHGTPGYIFALTNTFAGNVGGTSTTDSPEFFLIVGPLKLSDEKFFNITMTVFAERLYRSVFR